MKFARLASLLCLLFVFVASAYAVTTQFSLETDDKSYASSTEMKLGSSTTHQITNTVYNDTAKKYGFSWYPKGSPNAPVFKSEAPSKKAMEHKTRSTAPALTDGRIDWPDVSRVFAASYYRDGAAAGGETPDALLESTLGEEGLTWVICRSERSMTGPPWTVTHTIENTIDSPGAATIIWAGRTETLQLGGSKAWNFTLDNLAVAADTAKVTFSGSSYEHAFYANLWVGLK